jgi:hypothetical protein
MTNPGNHTLKALDDSWWKACYFCRELPPDWVKQVWKRLKKLAGTTGLEPATSDVTGRRSNQLNYVPLRCELRRQRYLTQHYLTVSS